MTSAHRPVSRRSWRAGRPLLAATVLLLATRGAVAGTAFTWTGTTNNNWDTVPTDLNWTTAWVNNPTRSSPNSAVFNLLTPATIDLLSNIDVTGITFTTGGWTIDGSSVLSSGGSPIMTITTTTGIDTINAAIADGSAVGTGGTTTSLFKQGTGTLVLGGADTYTGSTFIFAGTVQLGISNALNPAGTVTLSGATTLDLHGWDQAATTISGGSGTVKAKITNTRAGTSSTFTVNNASAAEFDGILQDGAGTVALVKNDAGTLTLTGQSSYSGVTTINQGSVIMGATASLVGSAITVNASGALTVTRDTGSSPATASVSSNAVALLGGTLSINGNFAPTHFLAASSTGGSLMIDSGATSFTAGGTNILDLSALPGGSAMRLGVDAGSTATIASTVAITPDSVTHTLRLGAGGGAMTINAVIGDVAATPTNLDFAGGATTILAGANSYTGLTTIGASSTVTVTNSSGLGAAASGTFVSAGGTLNISVPIAEPVILTGGTVNVNAADSGLIVVGVGTARIGAGGSVAPGSVMLTGGTLSLGRDVDPTSVLSTFSSGGVLAIDTGNAVPFTAGGTNAINFSTLSAGTAIRLGATLTASTIASSVQLTPDPATHTLRFGGGTLALTYNGQIADVAATPTNIDVTGGGLTILGGANTHTGMTTVNGSLQITNNSGLGAGSGTDADGTVVNGGGVLTTAAGVTLADEKIAANGGTINVATNGPVVVIAASSLSGTFGGGISGSAAISFSGATTINGSNDYTGAATIVSGGTVTLNTADGLGPDWSITVGSGGTLISGAGVTLEGAIIMNGGTANVTTNGPVNLLGAGTLAGTFNAPISGGGALTIGGSMTLAIANTYTGPTTIPSGVTVTVTDPLGLGSVVAGTTVLTGGTLTLNAASNEPIAVQGGTLNVHANAGGTVTESSGYVYVYVGALTNQTLNMSGGVAFIASPAQGPANVAGGTLTLTGAYAGPVTQTAGTINVNAAASFAALTSGGSFVINGPFAGTLTNNGASVQITAASSAAITTNSGITNLKVTGTNTIVANGGELDMFSLGTCTDSITLGTVLVENFGTGTFSQPIVIQGSAQMQGQGGASVRMPELLGSGILTTSESLIVLGPMNFSGTLAQYTGGLYNDITSSGALEFMGTTTIASSLNHTGWVYVTGPYQTSASGSLAINGGPSSISNAVVLDGSILTLNSDTTIGHLTLVNGILAGSATLTSGDGRIDFRSGTINLTGTAPGLNEIDKTTSAIGEVEALPAGFAGAINVSDGELQMDQIVNLSSAPITVSGNGSLRLVEGTFSNPIHLLGAGGPYGALVVAGEYTPSDVTVTGPVDLGAPGSSVGQSSGYGSELTLASNVSGGPLTINPVLRVYLTAPANSFVGLNVYGSTVYLRSTLAPGPINVSLDGTLDIDNSLAVNPDRVPDSSQITMQGATLALDALNQAGAVTTETLGSVTAAEGVNRIRVSQGIYTNVTATLTISSLQRAPAAVVAFDDGSAFYSTTMLGTASTGPHLILPSQAATDFMGGGYVYAGNGVSFVKYDPVNGVTPLQPSDYFTGDQSTWDANTIAMVPAGTTATLSGSRSVQALALPLVNDPYAAQDLLALGGNTLNITSGGLIVSGIATVSGTTASHLTAGGAASAAQLFIYGSNLSGYGPENAVISANITDNPGPDGQYDPTPGGPLDADNGHVSVIFASNVFALSGHNTYTGTTYIDSTVKYENAQSVASGPLVISTSGFVAIDGAFTAYPGAVLVQMGVLQGPGTLSPASLTLESGTISAPLAGAGPLTKTTAGAASVASMAAFTGPISVLGGTLSLTTTTLPNSVLVQGGSLTLSGFVTAAGDHLTVADGGTLTVLGTLYVPTVLNLNGGSIITTGLNFNPPSSAFTWTTGTLNFSGMNPTQPEVYRPIAVTWDSAAIATSTSGVFGAGLTLGAGQTLIVTGTETIGGAGPFNLTLGSGSTHSVHDGITLALGTFTQLAGSTLSYESFTQTGGTIAGAFQNPGTYTYQTGTFAGRLINQGLVNLGPVFTAGDGIENDTSITLPLSQVITVNGSGLDNRGLFIMAGGTLNGTGPLVNNATFSGSGIIGGTGGFTNNGTVSIGSGVLVISNSGPLVNAGTMNVTGGTLQLAGGAMTNSGVFSNAGTLESAVNVTNSGTFTQSGPQAWTAGTIFTNSGGEATFGSDAGSVSASPLSIVVSGGTVALNADQHLGRVTINGGMLLNGHTTTTAQVALNGGTLGGYGTIAGTVLAGSGPHTIAPSAGRPATSKGTLTFASLATNFNTTLALNLVTPGTLLGNDMIDVSSKNGLSIHSGTIQITGTSTGAASLGYYKILQYSGAIQGAGPASLILPAGQDNIAYTMDITHDPGYIDLHRGFLGDANDDGVVNGIDLGIMAGNFFNTNMNWTQGDFNGDGVVNGIDLGILAGNFFGTIGAFDIASASAGAASGVPEPASLLLLGAGLAGVLGTRRRARRLEA